MKQTRISEKLTRRQSAPMPSGGSWDWLPGPAGCDRNRSGRTGHTPTESLPGPPG